jgi:hypothetical protein
VTRAASKQACLPTSCLGYCSLNATPALDADPGTAGSCLPHSPAVRAALTAAASVLAIAAPNKATYCRGVQAGSRPLFC